MIFTIAKQTKFYPKFAGNREQKKEDQFYVVIGFPSVSEIAEKSSDVENVALFNFLIYAKSIHNFQIGMEDEGDVRDAVIQDVIDLPGLSELFTEIKEEYEKLIFVDKKK